MSDPTPVAWSVRTRDLRKSYRRGAVVAVAGLDLNIPRGGVHAFLGPNGSGKTTTLRMLLGLIRPDSGTMELLDHPVPDQLGRVIDKVGAIIEQPRFFPTMSAKSNLGILAEGIGTPAARVGEVIDSVGLTGRAKDAVGRYSLGMKQRLAIAATLLKDPELLIFDEPTNGLDPAGIHEVRETIRGLGASGRTVVVSSHLLAEVQQVADTVTIIGRGRTLREGRVADILGSGPASVRLRVADPDAAARVLLASGMSVQGRPDGALTIGRPGGVAPEEVAWTLGVQGIWPAELGVDADNLEAVFLELTRSEHLGATQSDGGSARHGIGGAA